MPPELTEELILCLSKNTYTHAQENIGEGQSSDGLTKHLFIVNDDVTIILGTEKLYKSNMFVTKIVHGQMTADIHTQTICSEVTRQKLRARVSLRDVIKQK